MDEVKWTWIREAIEEALMEFGWMGQRLSEWWMVNAGWINGVSSRKVHMLTQQSSPNITMQMSFVRSQTSSTKTDGIGIHPHRMNEWITCYYNMLVLHMKSILVLVNVFSILCLDWSALLTVSSSVGAACTFEAKSISFFLWWIHPHSADSG